MLNNSPFAYKNHSKVEQFAEQNAEQNAERLRNMRGAIEELMQTIDMRELEYEEYLLNEAIKSTKLLRAIKADLAEYMQDNDIDKLEHNGHTFYLFNGKVVLDD